MVVLVPAAFIGASLFNNEDPGENLRKVWDWVDPTSSDEGTTSLPEEVPAPPQPESQSDSAEPGTAADPPAEPQVDTQSENRVRYLEQQWESMKQEIEALEERVRALEQHSNSSPAVN